MDIEYWQRWITVGGLLIGFYGVLLLTAEWPYIVVDGVKKLAGFQETFEIRRAKKVRASYEKWTPRTSSRYKFVRDLAKGFLDSLPAVSRNIQNNLHDIAMKHEIETLNLVDEDGIIVVELVEKQAYLFKEFILDLKENGEPVNTSRRGLVYVLISLALQLFGALPV